MPADFTALTQSMADLTTTVANIETVVPSAVTALNGIADNIAKAVADALAADNTVDQATADNINSQVADIVVRAKKQTADLAAAIPANTPAAPLR